MWKTTEITKRYLYKENVEFAKRTAISQQVATQLQGRYLIYAIRDCLSTLCFRNVHYDHNPKPLCDVVEKFQHFVKTMKSDLHVYNVKNYNVTGFKLSCNFTQIKRIYMASFSANMIS